MSDRNAESRPDSVQSISRRRLLAATGTSVTGVAGIAGAAGASRPQNEGGKGRQGDVEVTTDRATEIGRESVTLNGTLEDLGRGRSSVAAADCWFEYRRIGADSWTATKGQRVETEGSFSRSVSGLSAGTDYEFRALGEPATGGTPARRDVGSIVSFTTEAEEPDSTGAYFSLDDGFARAAPWLSDDTPVYTVSEPTRDALADAVERSGERVIAFETSGTIDLGESNLRITDDRCWIAGQTAPSPGITLIRGGLYVEASDCVVQHIRLRAGDAGNDSGWEPDSGHTGDDTRNNVFDHVSASWGVDETLSVGYRTEDTTVSNCLIYEALVNASHSKGTHSMGSLTGDGSENVAYLGNLWAHNRNRNPRLKAGTTSALVNNVMYHFDRGTNLDDSAESSIVGNAYLRVNENDANIEGGRAYLEDNYSEPDTQMTSGVTELDEKPVWPGGLDALDASETESHVYAHAGARPADRTAHDARVVEQARERTGDWIDSQEEVGGYPDLPENYEELDVPDAGLRDWLRRQARQVEP